MTLPRSGAAEWAAAQASPEIPVNTALRAIDAGLCQWIVADRDLGSPPGSCADGANYLIASPDSGDWDTKAGQLATAKGTDAANGWHYTIVAVEGNRLYLQDEDLWIQYDGAAWQSSNFLNSLTLTVSTQTGTSYTAVLGDANTYIQFTNGSAITFTVPPNASVAFEIGTRLTIEQAGAGVVTITPDSGVTINSRGSLLDTAGQYAVVTLIKTATNTWTVAGDVA